ncbi:MAG: cysteine--tRNA ligase, partial [Burkholderiales bacterium]|nr:cysteine--tRNA ligase [Burkholderiales bacterium]
VNQDLNLPKALAVMWETLKSNLSDADKKATLNYFDQVLGLNLAAWQPTMSEIPARILDLAEQRKQSRINKNWAESDRLRDEIKALGYEMEDSAEGMKLKPIA